MTTDQITATYAALMLQRPLLQKVIGDLHLDTSPEQLATRIKVTPRPNTTILDVSAQDTNPERSSAIANALTGDFIAEIKDLQQQEVAQTSRPEDNLVVVSPALRPSTPVSPRPALNIAIALLGGLLLAIIAIAFREYLDQTIKSDDELLERTGLTPLGHIPFSPVPEGRLLVLDPKAPEAEAYRALRTNVIFSAIEHDHKVVVITSATASEGKSRTAANLAVALAQSGYRTLLVDADFRRPSLHRLFRRPRNVGMSNLIVQELPEEEVVVPVTAIPNLHFISSGPTPPNPSELLGSGRTRSLLHGFRERFSYVVVDTPPVNAVTDAAVVAPGADAVILVAASGRTSYAALAHARDAVARVGGHIIGVVVNMVQGGGDYAYYTSSDYGSYGDAHSHRRRPFRDATGAESVASTQGKVGS